MTTTELAADPQTIAIEQLADIVSGTAVFQASVAKYDKDGAREHIHKSFHRPPDGEITGPLAVIFELPGMRWDRRADGVVLPFGELFLDLWTPMESEDGEFEERRFNNWHGQIAQAISNYNGPGFRMLTTQTDPPQHSDPASGDKVPVWRVGYTVQWGAL